VTARLSNSSPSVCPLSKGTVVPTLHIEHAITDLDTWLGAFGRFSDARRNAGVVTQRLRQPVDDAKYIVVDLEFETAQAAESFKEFLETVVWRSADLSPGLGGVPIARVLDDVARPAEQCRPRTMLLGVVKGESVAG
jgi:hypothetical protein